MNEPTAAANPDSAQDLTANMDASEDINTTISGDTPDADSSALGNVVKRCGHDLNSLEYWVS